MSDSHPPEASVVVASFTSGPSLERCLESLNVAASGAEIVVATCLNPKQVKQARERFPRVIFLFFDKESWIEDVGLRETRVFRLRSHGVAAARGRIIALLEDHCTAGPDWLSSLVAAHDTGQVIAGGPVDNGLRGYYDWSLFWCEYAALVPPFSEPEPEYLSAVNASYTRESLQACQDKWRNGFYDNEVHDSLIRTGFRFHLVPDACVRTHLSLPFRRALQHLYTGGKRYGGYRAAQISRARRLLLLAAAPAIPVLLLSRIIRVAAGRRPEQLNTVWLGLPWILCFLSAWALGELRGTLRGRSP